jgi:Xaa-Pro aminopeptidase
LIAILHLRMRRFLIGCLLLLSITGAALDRQPNADYHARRVALSQKLGGGVAILFARAEARGPDALYAFHQDENFYYLTGWSEPGAALLIAGPEQASGKSEAHPYTEILFLPPHNPSQENWTGPKLAPGDPDATKATGFDRVEALDRMRDEIVRLLPPVRATIYADLPSYENPTPTANQLDWLWRGNAFPVYVKFEDVKLLLAPRRMVKDAGEMVLIRKAVDASMAAHLAAMHTVHPGMNEREVAALMHYEFERRGCERPAYEPIVGAGAHATVLHYEADSGPINGGDVLLLDVAGEYSYYASDITRTLPANGKFSARQRELYDIVLGAQEAAIAAFRAGQSHLSGSGPDSLNKVATEYLNSHGKDIHGRPLGRYFIHGVGHQVGLNVHDATDPSLPLDKGMVFTLEPGLYIPEEKIGIRIEDMFYVDDAGQLVRLTSALPRTADEVEKAMAAR